MTKYHAVYRATLPVGYGNPMYSDMKTPNSGTPIVAFTPSTDVHDCYISLACDLDDLSDSQLESLFSLVDPKHWNWIRVSKDWSADKKKYNIIFLINDTDYQNLNTADRIDLDRWKKCFERAIDDSGVDARFVAPLKCCLEVAEKVRKPKVSATEEQAEKKKRTPKKNTVPERLAIYFGRNPLEEGKVVRGTELAKKLKECDGLPCSVSAIYRTKTWKTIYEPHNRKIKEYTSDDIDRDIAIAKNHRNRGKTNRPPEKED